MLGFIQAPTYLCFSFMCFDGVYESDIRQANLPFSLLIFIFIPAPRFSLSLRVWFWEEDCHTQTLAHHFHWTLLNLHTHTVTQSATARQACCPLAAVSDFTFVFLSSVESWFAPHLWSEAPAVCCFGVLGSRHWSMLQSPPPFRWAFMAIDWANLGWLSKLIATALILINLIATVRFC